MSKVAQYMAEFTIGRTVHIPTSKYASKSYGLNDCAGSSKRLNEIKAKKHTNNTKKYPATVYRCLGDDMLRVYYGANDEDKKVANILFNMLMEKFGKDGIVRIFEEVKNEQSKCTNIHATKRAEMKNKAFIEVAKKHLCVEQGV